VIACWKGIIKEIHFGGSIMPSNIIENLNLEKPSFGPSKWPQKLKPAKNSKLPKLSESHFEPFGKGGWSPISTWISLVLSFLFCLIRLCRVAIQCRQLELVFFFLGGGGCFGLFKSYMCEWTCGCVVCCVWRSQYLAPVLCSPVLL
jgi:hypothetical protein